MGRHEIASSSMRSPAVIVGVPVAAVLATMGGNAMVGGVLPSAEEIPLRAASTVGDPAGELPAPPSWSPSATDGIADLVDDTDHARPSGPEGGDEDAATGTLRVVRVADDAPAHRAVAPRPDGDRVAHAGPDRAAERADDGVRERAGTGGESDDRGPSARAVPAASGSTDSTTDPGEQVVAAPSSSRDDRDDGADGADGGSVLALDTPAGGLSVLSFG